MSKYLRKPGIKPSISKYFQGIGSQGGRSVTPRKLEMLAELRARRKAKREAIAASVGIRGAD
jgi:hypothetical protein